MTEKNKMLMFKVSIIYSIVHVIKNQVFKSFFHRIWQRLGLKAGSYLYKGNALTGERYDATIGLHNI